MPERNPVLRLAARMARGREIDWDAEERAAASEEDREGVRHLRTVAAMSVVNRALMSGASREDLSVSLSLAKSLSGAGAPDPSIRKRSSRKAEVLGASPGAGDERAPALPPGTRWGPLEVLDRVGSGAFGEVYRARDTRLDREVALKILSEDASDERDAVVREARLLARIRHPNVVTVYGADRIDGRVGIWTEFLRGQTLDRRLADHGVQSSREAALVGIDLCRALSAAHAAGIVHQDIKLSNVLRAEGGRIVLVDFGLGREVAPVLPPRASGRRLSGTPLFMAPEALTGGKSDARTDIYSLGVVLFALVTGSLPVEASTLEDLRAKHARRERRAARDLRPDLPVSFVRFLQRALAADPEARFQTAGEAESALLASLEAATREPGDADAPPEPGALQGPGALRKPDAVQEPGAPQRASSIAPHRLPAEIDAFVGRASEISELAERLRAGARLVTLLGAGGIGKTRLAVRYGWLTLSEWPGGVWFCDLTEARTRDGIAFAVAQGLGASLDPGDAVRQIGHTIAARGRCLLILDNFEQVVEEAPETVARWLERAEDARFLVTSRERLKLPGEEAQVVDSLPLESGMELFVERGRRQRPIELSGTEGESVREIVRLLEGIPLAIELSAARLRVMTPGQMVDRIGERFRILGGAETGRHATLKAAIDASWELLKPWERSAFAQCSVFEGGFDLEAAEAVIDLRPWPESPWVVDLVQSLVDKSLLRSWVLERDRSHAGAVMRFGMFVSLQEYAREKLVAGGEVQGGEHRARAVRDAEQRHARWFARLGREDAIAALDRAGGVERRQALVTEIENIVAAARRMAEHGDGAAARECYRAAWAVLELKGPLALAVELGTQLLHIPLEPDERSGVLYLLGQAIQRSGRTEEARRRYEESLALDRERGDRRSEGRTLARIASLALNEGRIEEALIQHEAALAIHREVGDRRSEGIALGNVGLGLHEQGRLEEAGDRLEAALAIHRETGNRRSEGVVLGNLGNLRREQGRTGEALALFEAALAIHREVGNRRFEGIVLANLGALCQGVHRMEEARAHFEAALAIHRGVGARHFEGHALVNLANLCLEEGRRAEARSGFEAALAIHHEVGNRRGEGIVLGLLGSIHLEEGGLEEARALLADGAALLRSADYPVELGKLLCTRAECEARVGDAGAARDALGEAEALAARAGVGPDSDLGRSLAKARRALSRSGGGADARR